MKRTRCTILPGFGTVIGEVPVVATDSDVHDEVEFYIPKKTKQNRLNHRNIQKPATKRTLIKRPHRIRIPRPGHNALRAPIHNRLREIVRIREAARRGVILHKQRVHSQYVHADPDELGAPLENIRVEPVCERGALLRLEARQELRELRDGPVDQARADGVHAAEGVVDPVASRFHDLYIQSQVNTLSKNKRGTFNTHIHLSTRRPRPIRIILRQHPNRRPEPIALRQLRPNLHTAIRQRRTINRANPRAHRRGYNRIRARVARHLALRRIRARAPVHRVRVPIEYLVLRDPERIRRRRRADVQEPVLDEQILRVVAVDLELAVPVLAEHLLDGPLRRVQRVAGEVVFEYQTHAPELGHRFESEETVHRGGADTRYGEQERRPPCPALRGGRTLEPGFVGFCIVRKVQGVQFDELDAARAQSTMHDAE